SGLLLVAVRVQVPDQHGQHFGVSLAGERVPLLGEELLQRRVIFDDAVVNQRDAAGVVGVRVGVDLGRRAVGGPAGVGHADVGVRQALAVLKRVFQNAD